jgi:hypothetical protein
MMTEIFRLFWRLMRSTFLLRHRAEHVFLVARKLAEPGDIVERTDKTEVLEFLISVGDRRVGRLDVQIGVVIRQNRHFVCVEFFLILVRQLPGLAAKMFQQFGDKSPSARGEREILKNVWPAPFASDFAATTYPVSGP